MTVNSPVPAQIKDLCKDFNNGQIIAAIGGAVFLGFGIYAMHLSIKANRLSIKALTAQGFK